MYSTILSKKRIEERKRMNEKLHAKNLMNVKLSMDLEMGEVSGSINSHSSTHLAPTDEHTAAELVDPETTSKPEGETADLNLLNDGQNGNENNMEEDKTNTANGEETQNGGNGHYTAMQAFVWHWNALNYWGGLLSMQGVSVYAPQPIGSVSWAPPIVFLPQRAVGHVTNVPQPPAMAFRPNGGIVPYPMMPMYVTPASNTHPSIASRSPIGYVPPPPPPGFMAQFVGTVPPHVGSAATTQMSNANYISMPVAMPATILHDTPNDNSDTRTESNRILKG